VLDLPTEPLDALAPDAPAAAERRPAALAGLTALVIDDDERNIFALTTLLERGGLRVVSAGSGADGLALLASDPGIDIVLVDIMMPIMDGYAAIRAMRRLTDRALPIIALTASVRAGERQRCVDAGATAYLSKPVQGDLLVLLGEWLPVADPVGSR
jgi:CheY-like chemotaxis protein